MTDWDAILKAPESVGVEAAVKQIEALEPLAIASPDMHKVFVCQQLIRIGLRQRKGLPVVSAVVCGYCGVHPCDPVLETCLYCHEERQFVDYGDYGYIGGYLQPMFDADLRLWGMNYKNGSGDSKYQMWAVLGYKTLRQARLALYPVFLYNDWLQRETKGMSNVDASDLVDLDFLMTQALPYTPEQFELVLRQKIAEHMDIDKDFYRSSIKSAIHDYDWDHHS